MLKMLGVGCKVLKVVGSVVLRVPVDVVNNLRCQQIATDLLFLNKSVLRNVARASAVRMGRRPHIPVAADQFATALPVGVFVARSRACALSLQAEPLASALNARQRAAQRRRCLELSQKLDLNQRSKAVRVYRWTRHCLILLAKAIRS